MSPDADLPKIGVWRAVGEFKFKELFWPEGLCALVIGVGGSIPIIATTKVVDRAAAAGDLLILSGAFLAVVFTALAILVSLPSSSYLRLLGATSDGGMRRFLDPFLIAVGTQIAIVLLALTYRLVGADLPRWIEHASFGLISFLFIFGLLDIAALARQLVRHGLNRAEDAADDQLDQGHPGQSTSLRRLPGSTGRTGK